MANFNKVMLMGNLTRDPELKYAGEAQTAICRMGLAVNRTWNNQAGEKQEETCFVDITVFGRQAETCNEYLSKGRPVFIEGRLNFNTWEDRETGAKRSKLDVVAERVQFLGGRDDNQQGGGGQQGGGQQQNRGGQQQRGGQQGGGQYEQRSPPNQGVDQPSGGGGGQSHGIDYDDIPF